MNEMPPFGFCYDPSKPIKYPMTTPSCVGYCVHIHQGEFFHVESKEPLSDREIALAISAYRAGVQDGKVIGRSILQNEFRNLMGLQR